MINNAIIVIPCNVGWDWSTDYINQTARILGQKNTVICVFWIDAQSIKEHITGRKKYPLFFQKIERGVIGYYAIHLLPFRRFDTIFRFNIWINMQIVQLYCFFSLLRKHSQKKILWFFDPVCYPIIKQFNKTWLHVYDCIDYFRGDPVLSVQEQLVLIKHENELIKRADIVTVNSFILHSLHERVRHDIHIVPQGFRLDAFTLNRRSAIVLSKDKPIIGYVGALNYRLNYRLLVALAKRLPQYYFVLVGPLQESNTAFGKASLAYARKHLFILPNVKVIFGVPKEEIKNIIAQFDMGIIPYRTDMKFNTYCYPMKLFEYFYMGKPVVSSLIQELAQFPKYVYMCKSVNDWEYSIQSVSSSSWPLAIKKRQKTLALENTWKKKINTIIQIIQLDQKLKTTIRQEFHA